MSTIAHISSTSWPIVAIGGVLMSTMLLSCRERARSRRRQKQLVAARDALSRHKSALTFLLGDPRTPERVRKHVLYFSEAIATREYFVEILKYAIRNYERPDTKPFDKDVNLLAVADPALREAFSTCVSAGLASAILRFPETGELVEATFARILGDPKKEAAVFVRATQVQRQAGPHLAPIPA